jgi:adenylate cyclase
MRARLLWVLAVLITLAPAALSSWQPPLWRQGERSVEDQLQRLRGVRKPPRELVLIEIDDATLQQGSWFDQQPHAPAWSRGIGTLPWPRARYGDLLERVLAEGASAVAINVVFAGPSAKGPADDEALARQLQRHGDRVALAADMLEPQDDLAGSALTLVQPDVLVAGLRRQPLTGLSNVVPAAAGEPAHHPEHYGQMLLQASGVRALPSLGTRLLQVAGRPSRQVDVDRWLNYYGPSGSFAHLPAWQVLDPARWSLVKPTLKLRGALVLIGPVVADGAAGVATPFGRLSGLELMATAAANSLDGTGLRPWPTHPLARRGVSALPALLMLLLLYRRRGLVPALGSGALALAAIGVVTGLAFSQGAVLLPALGATTAVIALVLLFSGEAYLTELVERRRLRRTFERYVAPAVVRTILADPRSAEGLLQGRLLPVTVLFSDLKGFTQLTQRRSRDGQIPLHLRQLNTYLGAMVEVISDHGGTVDKFIGDCVMAVFGSPLSRGQQTEAVAAVRCGQAMARRLAELNATWALEGLDPLACGVGLASGEVAVGQIGSPQRLDFTVIGDTVNLAARLESLTRVVAVPLLLDNATAQLVTGEIVTHSVGVHSIKGVGEVEAFRC